MLQVSSRVARVIWNIPLARERRLKCPTSRDTRFHFTVKIHPIQIYIYIEIETIDLLSFRLIGTINFSLSNTKHERSELIIIPIKLLEDKVAPYLETGPAAWEEIFLWISRVSTCSPQATGRHINFTFFLVTSFWSTSYARARVLGDPAKFIRK